VPAETWVDDRRVDPELACELLHKGLLLSDTQEQPFKSLRERDEALSANQWNLFGALYHYMTKWSGVDIRREDQEDPVLGDHARQEAEAFIAEHGPPPPEFAEPRSDEAVSLPGAVRQGDLYRALANRRTTRAFDSAPMRLEQLDTILRYVFGCQGFGTTTTGFVCIKRTSPSAGALHPIEVYPIITNVDGVAPGVYQYCGGDHSLRPILLFDGAQGRRTATSFMCGQAYLGAAHVSFVLTARFYRSHWKYRRHQKAYATILMDAGHLSQTLYLVCAELGLGAFVTTAINAHDVEEQLGLDGIGEGVIAMSGCGPKAADASPLELQVSPAPPF
jgi:putative peptide maturation dehydrogenase